TVRLIVTVSMAALPLLSAAPGRASALRLMWTHEATIADIQAALRARQLTCRQLVQMYIDRIEAYDRRGPALNAIVLINPGALAAADALDARLAQAGPAGPLPCGPAVGEGHYGPTRLPTPA